MYKKYIILRDLQKTLNFSKNHKKFHEIPIWYIAKIFFLEITQISFQIWIFRQI